jgi:hypothetical protein
MNAFDPSYFESSQKRKRRLRIRVVTYAFRILRLRAGFHYLAILAFFLPCQLVFTVVGYQYDAGTVSKTHQQTWSFVPVGDCDRSAHSIRVTASQLCALLS